MRRSPRRGTTLIELCVVTGILAALFAIALPRVRRAADRIAARGAIQEVSSLFSLARRAAIARRSLVAVVIDDVGGSITVRVGSLVVAHRSPGTQYGVKLAASRDSMSYDPRGLGYGAANLTVIARRGAAAETLFVSRLGRTRH